MKGFDVLLETWLNLRPESGLDCLTCSKFARGVGFLLLITLEPSVE